MTEQEDAALLAQGQMESDMQMLETLLTLDPVAREQFDYLHMHAYCDQSLADFTQVWREWYQVS